jgi:nicotinate-nucleotide pyrophosphorylase (carboxylating)
MMEYCDNLSIEELVGRALFEDLGKDGDVTSRAVFEEGRKGRAIIESKDTGVLSGAFLLRPIFQGIDPSIEIKKMTEDGSPILPGSELCVLYGSLRSICAGERVALNFLQRLSGIATATAGLARLIAHTKARLLDTRKTTPLLRALEKRAVIHGGGKNHRLGLFDMVLIKDTHVKAAGGVAQALKRVRSQFAGTKGTVTIEIEIQTWDELLEALPLMPDRIMLDNMTLELMTACVARVRSVAPRIELEASGNIDEQSIVKVAETGVDFISVGALTHSVKSLDIHLVIV